ncbi:SLC10A7 (predicted) [Pycnogonum litorale]
MLLFIIYTTFCDTFSREELGVDVTDLIGISLLVLLIQILLLCLCFFVTTFRQLGFSSADTVAIMFCATHKSLTLGIPILKILFGGYDYLSTISIPLLIYHPTQILLGGLIVPYLRTWLRLSTRLDLYGLLSSIWYPSAAI